MVLARIDPCVATELEQVVDKNVGEPDTEPAGQTEKCEAGSIIWSHLQLVRS